MYKWLNIFNLYFIYLKVLIQFLHSDLSLRNSEEKQGVEAQKALGAGRTRSQTRRAGDKFLLQNRDGSIFLGEFGGREGLCNKHSIPGKEIFPPHVFQVPISSPLCSFCIIKDHLEEPTSHTQHFWPIYSDFLLVSKHRWGTHIPAFDPLLAKLFRDVPGHRGWRDLHLSPSFISTAPFSLDSSPKTAPLGHQYKPRAVHSVHRKIKE